MHFYITGDTHRSFDRIEDFCYGYETTTEDVIITEVLHLNKGERKIWARNEWKIVLM